MTRACLTLILVALLSATLLGCGAERQPMRNGCKQSPENEIVAALAPRAEIYPILPQARALAPQLPQPPAPLNPSPGASLLIVLVVLMLIWMV